MRKNKNETIISESNVGQRLNKLTKKELYKLSYKGKTFSIVSTITLGRDKENDIQIDDTLTSRFHAVIQKIKDAYFLKDLDSTNGTFINGKKVPKDKYCKLHQDDTIRLGRTEITIL